MADTPKRRPCRMQTVQTECSFLTLDSLFRLFSRAESHQSQTFQMSRGKLHRILSNFGRSLSFDNLTVCAPSHYSVLFTFDKSEMFTCRWTYWISVPTFLNCWLSSREILASHRSTRYFTWSSMHRSCVAVVLPFFLVLLLVFFRGSGSAVNLTRRIATTSSQLRTATTLSWLRTTYSSLGHWGRWIPIRVWLVPGEGGYSQKRIGLRCAACFPKPLTYVWPMSVTLWYSLPYLWPEQKYLILFKTWTLNKNHVSFVKGYFDFRVDNEKVASWLKNLPLSRLEYKNYKITWFYQLGR